MDFSNPTSVIQEAGLSPGQTVADIGCGAGHYSIEAAKVVGPEGRVFAVDVQKDLIERVRVLAEHEDLSNIEVAWGDIEHISGSMLKESSLDIAIIANMFFQVEKKTVFMQEIKRILKPKAKIIFVDWSESFGGIGPHADHIVSKEQALALFKDIGFELEKDLPAAGSHHYGLLLTNHHHA